MEANKASTRPQGVATRKSAGAAIAVNVGLKALLAGLLAFAVLSPELPQFQGKAMTTRALTYPISALIVPLVVRLRRRTGPYPHLLDALVVLPFVVDSGGNALDLYNTTEWFDRFAHWFNWVTLVTAFGSAISSLGLSRFNVAATTVGFGATTHVLWEIIEYALMMAGSSGLQLTYGDTMQDLILSFCGSLTGALLTTTVLWRARLVRAGTTAAR